MKHNITIRTCSPHDTPYGDVCRFASRGYEKHYGISLEAYPDTFVYAEMESEIVGCFGGYFGSIHQPLTTEWYVSETDLTTLVGGPIERFPRSKLVEMGTKAVNLPPDSGTNSVRVSMVLSVALLTHLHNCGGRFSLFTTDRSVNMIAKQLNVNLTHLGKPDLSRRNTDYREKWAAYFSVPRECFAFDLEQASSGCHKTFAQFSDIGFMFEPGLLNELSPEPVLVA